MRRAGCATIDVIEVQGETPSGAARHPWNTSFAWARPDTEPRRLSNRQVDDFRELGWIVVEDLLDDDTRAELTGALDAIEAEFDRSMDDRPDGRFLISEQGAVSFTAFAVRRSGVARRVSRLPAIVDLCHDLVGSDVRLYQLVYKKPDRPREFPWQDGDEVLDGDPSAGPPIRRRRQDDPDRQYPVLQAGRAAPEGEPHL